MTAAIEPDTSAIELAAHVGATLKALSAGLRGAFDMPAISDPAGGDAAPEGSAVPCSLLRLERLADVLLAVGGKQALQPQDVDPDPVLRELARLLPRLLGHGIEVDVHVDASCPRLRADPKALEDALLHLVRKARDAMPDGGRLVLFAHPAEPGRVPAVALGVTDSGVGMTNEAVAWATMPFHSTKSDDPAAGLGLAAAAGFVRQSGGSTVLRSEPGRGTTVILLLPEAR